MGNTPSAPQPGVCPAPILHTHATRLRGANGRSAAGALRRGFHVSRPFHPNSCFRRIRENATLAHTAAGHTHSVLRPPAAKTKMALRGVGCCSSRRLSGRADQQQDKGTAPPLLLGGCRPVGEKAARNRRGCRRAAPAQSPKRPILTDGSPNKIKTKNARQKTSKTVPAPSQNRHSKNHNGQNEATLVE